MLRNIDVLSFRGTVADLLVLKDESGKEAISFKFYFSENATCDKILQ